MTSDVPKTCTFVDSSDAHTPKYQERVPIKLVFCGKKLQELAHKHLKTHLVMALKGLSVSDFLAEVFLAMKFGRLHKHDRISVVFRGWSQTAAIEFKDSTLIEKVYMQISSIEETRHAAKDA
jgi:hypothetical protein